MELAYLLAPLLKFTCKMYSTNKIAFAKTETFALKIVNASSLKFVFGDIEKLRDKFIRAVEVFQVANVSESPDNLVLVNNTVFQRSFATFAIRSGTEDVNKLSLYSMLRDNNNGTPMLFDWLRIDFPKSYVELANSGATVANEAFLFTFYYVDKEGLPEHVKKRYGIKIQ